MASTEGGVLVSEGGIADRAIQLAAGKVLRGVGTNQDPVPADLLEGTYTPVATLAQNCAVTPAVSYYKRQGNQVTVWGVLSVNITTDTTLSFFELSLPIASDLASASQLAGVAAANKAPIWIQGTSSNNTALFTWTSNGNGVTVVPFQFSYVVI